MSDLGKHGGDAGNESGNESGGEHTSSFDAARQARQDVRNQGQRRPPGEEEPVREGSRIANEDPNQPNRLSLRGRGGRSLRLREGNSNLRERVREGHASEAEEADDQDGTASEDGEKHSPREVEEPEDDNS